MGVSLIELIEGELGGLPARIFKISLGDDCWLPELFVLYLRKYGLIASFSFRAAVLGDTFLRIAQIL